MWELLEAGQRNFAKKIVSTHQNGVPLHYPNFFGSKSCDAGQHIGLTMQDDGNAKIIPFTAKPLSM